MTAMSYVIFIKVTDWLLLLRFLGASRTLALSSITAVNFGGQVYVGCLGLPI